MKKTLALLSAAALSVGSAQATFTTDITSALTGAQTDVNTILGWVATFVAAFVVVKLGKRAVNKI
jgi:carbohydrate-selective porin OprB